MELDKILNKYTDGGRPYLVNLNIANISPCDEDQEDNLDFLYATLQKVTKNKILAFTPFPTDGLLLDVGCGTGIRAFGIANEYKNAIVIGIDEHKIQPKDKPRNCIVINTPIENFWDIIQKKWDHIHLGLRCGEVKDWSTFYGKILEDLRPGAWFEQVEFDFYPYGDKSLEGTALREWYGYMEDATNALGRPLSHECHKIVTQLREVGFENIAHNSIHLPLFPRQQDQRERHEGIRYYRRVVTDCLQPMSLNALSHGLGWSSDQVDCLVNRVKSELEEGILAYNILHIYKAQKPV